MMWLSVLGLFCGIALGTLVGLPVAPLYILAGVLLGPSALPLVTVALLVHLVLAFVISRYYFRGFITRLTSRWLPRFTFAHPLGPRRLILLVRLIPGLPLFLQSYLLGLSPVPFDLYLLWSFVAHLPQAFGFVLAGQAFIQGQWLYLAAAVAFILLISLVSRLYASSSQR